MATSLTKTMPVLIAYLQTSASMEAAEKHVDLNRNDEAV